MFLGRNVLLGNYMTAVLGNPDAYVASLMAASRFLMCGIEEDAAIALDAEDVAWMVSSPVLCTRLGRAPFPDGQPIVGQRFPAQPTGGHFFHQSLNVVSTGPSRIVSLLLSVHGPDVVDPVALLGSYRSMSARLADIVLAESFTPLPPGITVDPPSAQEVHLPPRHIIPTALDLNFELRVCRDRLVGADDRVRRAVAEGGTYTYVDHQGHETKGPKHLQGPLSPHLASRFSQRRWPRADAPDDATGWS
jgi:hypothetical protein